MTTHEMSMFLVTFADGTTAAGIGTSTDAARAWVREVAIPPYDTMEITGCEDYRDLSVHRKAEIALLHAPRVYQAACPECGEVHTCEPWATMVCVDCRHRRKRAEKRTPIERWQAEQGEVHGHYAVLAGFEKALTAHDEMLKEAYESWDVDIQLKLFEFVVAQIEAAVKATRMAIKGGMDDTGL